ncbi:uncharacterized protein LOC110681765 [Chenopodium quinoa]|uniref:uncharacterized protein LOC110681765 n=1 Tax=Chenopodium quinoa TaxID=63459 RepID=UPI000B76FCBF|nr:uncharacterized protein LOC110681765 [Chenopodium quinoa]
MLSISFSEEDAKGVIYPHDDPLVLILTENGADIKRALVDGGSSANILFARAFDAMRIGRKYLTPVSYPVIGFNGSTVRPEGSIVLQVRMGEGPAVRDVMAEFLVIDVPSAYNAIVGRPLIHDMQAVVSTYHLTMVYVSNAGTTERVRGSQTMARECYVSALKQPGRQPTCEQTPAKRERIPSTHDLAMENFDTRPVTAPRPSLGGETVKIELQHGVPGRLVRVGSDIDVDTRCYLVELLRESVDVFAFSADEMPGIHPDVIVHKLNVNRRARPVRQKKRNFSTEKMEAIRSEVNKLLAAGFIEPCTYPEWLANVVMVRKPSMKWRMCVDFTDLNRACPKDCYPLPRIDRLVDSTSGHALLSFMDAFSGYHQVSLYEPNRTKAAFITDSGVFCYKAMPFGLRNAGATYQKLVDKVFTNQKGRNVEVYVDDSIVKIHLATDHVADLRETFETLRRYRMKLNPEKCVFGVRSGKFLGFMVSERGIDANPDKIEAILSVPEPKCIKDIHRLTGRMAALTRFISKSADKALPFFVILRQNKLFEWGKDQSKAFQAVKIHLRSLPTVARPEQGEILHLYISASAKTVAAVLLVERQKTQLPIYFVSHVLNAVERRYPLVEKIAYAVVVAARKLRPYFDAHAIDILTNQPLEKSLQKMETSGRLLKWAIELSEYVITYKPRVSIKAQALSDFIVETSYYEEEDAIGVWKVLVDGSSASTGLGAGVIMISPQGDVFEYAVKFKFKASNNEAEYEAALAGIQLCISAEARRIEMTTDSQLVANQFNGTYETREPSMTAYLAKLKSVASGLDYFKIKLVPRAMNTQADALAKLASSSFNDLERTVMVEILKERSIDEQPPKDVCFTTAGREWYDDILA